MKYKDQSIGNEEFIKCLKIGIIFANDSLYMSLIGLFTRIIEKGVIL